MANARGIVRLTAGGEEYRLQYTVNAWCELEEAAGMSMGEFLEGLSGGGLSITKFRLLVWAGLIANHPDMTLPESGRIIDQAGGIAGLSDTIEAAITASMPDPDGEKTPGKTRGAARL